MKKIFTLAAAVLACVSMSAQETFSLYFFDTKVENGKTYEVGYVIEDEYDDPDLGKEYTYALSSNLFAMGDEGTQVVMEVTAESGAAAVCSLDGKCINLSSGQSIEKRGKLGLGMEDLQIHGLNAAGQQMDIVYNDETPSFQETTLIVKAWEEDYEEGGITEITLKLLNVPNSSLGGIQSTVAEKDYIKAVNGNILNYSVSRPATLSIYAITGNLVAKYPIANAGSINLSALTKGIYIYTDGRNSGKILVR